MRIDLIACWLGSLSLLHCGGNSMDPQAFCSQMPVAICARLLDTSCVLPGLTRDQVRYASIQACEQAERLVCEALIQDPQLGFDQGNADQCITQIERADCQESLRAEFHACDEVFIGIERPIQEWSPAGPS